MSGPNSLQMRTQGPTSKTAFPAPGPLVTSSLKFAMSYPYLRAFPPTSSFQASLWVKVHSPSLIACCAGPTPPFPRGPS